MNINVQNIDKAQVLLILYNAAPAPQWMTNTHKSSENPYKRACKFLKNCEIRDRYFIGTIDLGRGVRLINVNFRGPELNLARYTSQLRFFDQSLIDAIQQMIEALPKKSFDLPYLDQITVPSSP